MIIRAIDFPYDSHQVYRPVFVGRKVWIGMNLCVLPGASIGDGAIVGMGTVVAGSVPELSTIGSQPWRQIGGPDRARYSELDRSGAYGSSGGRAID